MTRGTIISGLALLALTVALPAAAQDRSVATPVTRAATAVSPISPVSQVSAVRVFTPLATTVSATAQPVLASAGSSGGLPRPSIILGIVAQPERTFDALPESTEAEVEEIAWDNLAARQAMQRQDTELYARLVETGAFDPPEGSLTRALQTELARMNCYGSGIDGDWGRGSQASVTRYVEAGGAEPPDGTDATIGLWRHIIAADDVECPEIVIAAPARPAASSGGSTSSRPTTTQARPQTAAVRPPAPPPAQPTQQPTATSSRGLGLRGGTGALR
ncbi:hypothetical protein [Jannaschia pohangensis]|uniref:Peptidoglycan binding domain-containing protein n=1 Tax=Jannaschia pohangensis TaxID=390807 RepID=A0A1I3UIC2_9RHOB|nr:hypothetical protein [Jannaschia pohangensis]SFJ83244.1 hypothetical protein SAMN04488095_3783 [Jannaschia pohangensis]